MSSRGRKEGKLGVVDDVGGSKMKEGGYDFWESGEKGEVRWGR